MNKPNILIVICYDRDIVPAVEAAVYAIAARHRAIRIYLSARPIDYNRNNAVRMFLENPQYTHLMFIDSDTEPPLDAMEKLIDCRAPIASGVYRLAMPSGIKWAVLDNCDGTYHLRESLPSTTDRFIADAGGAGCLLVERIVFESIGWPWFKFVERKDGRLLGEDVYFFKRANKAGFRAVFDPSVRCIHHKTLPI
ncbi:hypothetical protein ACQ9LF_06275 [Anaerohalosphaeraceae bacterium U12dextr]|jgi:hypothetical protein